MYANTDVKSVSDLIALSTTYDPHKVDYRTQTRDLTLDESAHLLVKSRALFQGQTRLALTDHALGQMCERLTVPPVQYMRACPANLRATNLNHWLASRPNAPWLVRAYTDGDLARAVLSTRYVPLDNTLVLRSLQRVIADTPHKLVYPYLDRDTLHAKFTFADDEGGNYAVGVYVKNGETGNHALAFAPFIQRHACTNSIIFSEESYTQRHAFVTPAYVAATIKEMMGQMLKRSAVYLEEIVKAEADEIPDLGAVVASLCREKNLSQEVHDLILVGTEGAPNRMGIVNGLSYAAHQLDDVEAAVALEALAGRTLTHPRYTHARRPAQMEL